MAEQQSKQNLEAEGVAEDLKLALAASEAECERLRHLLKELQEKLASLRSAADGADGRFSQMIDGSGLGEAINSGLGTCGLRGVFRRLYDDAMDRLVRMADMRHKFFLEIAKAWGPSTFPPSLRRELAAPLDGNIEPSGDVELHRVDLVPPEGENVDRPFPDPKVPKVPRWLVGVHHTHSLMSVEAYRVDQHAPTFIPALQAPFPAQLNHAANRYGMKADVADHQASPKGLQLGHPYVTESPIRGAGGGMRLFGPTLPADQGARPAAAAYILDNNPRLRADAFSQGKQVPARAGHPLGGPIRGLPLNAHPVEDVSATGLAGVSRVPSLPKIPVGMAGSKAVSLPLLT
jgi:hypothetical protein